MKGISSLIIALSTTKNQVKAVSTEFALIKEAAWSMVILALPV